MEKLSPNRGQLFVRNKYTVLTMGGTVALRSVNNNFSGELQFCSYVYRYNVYVLIWISPRWLSGCIGIPMDCPTVNFAHIGNKIPKIIF